MRIPQKPKFIFSVLLLIFILNSNAQTVTLKGSVTDSLQNPLSYANLLATPTENNKEVRFAITDENGTYRLKLNTNTSYTLTVSYLGFTSLKTSLKYTKKEDITKNFILTENPDQLEEVTLTYTPPIVVKKDTISYTTDKFTTGTERKLRDVLKRLPGVEVDRDGNVTSQGKKVKQVLVENKLFFNGNSKLAVNNIPGDAIDKVQMIDNYSSVKLLKGLEDSDDLIMNIKLKEDKKKFVFGDIEAGGGIKSRYIIHPKLFYYSPKTSVNYIGDINNISEKSFGFGDYIDFEGGFSKLLNKSGSIRSIFNASFLQFLNNTDFISNSTFFNAFNLRHSVSGNTDISTYIINTNSDIETQSERIAEYINPNSNLLENRETGKTLDNNFTIGKLALNYINDLEDLEVSTFIKTTNNSSQSLIQTQTNSDSNFITEKNHLNFFDFTQAVNYTLKLNKQHTATIAADYNYAYNSPEDIWKTDQPILNAVLPIITDTEYIINSNKTTKTHNFNAVAKDYWVLNNLNHIYTTIGLSHKQSSYETIDKQTLSDGTTNNFNSAGFNNDFNNQLTNTFVGVEYKFKLGKFIARPGLFYHYYQWFNTQYDARTPFNKTLFLPQLDTELTLSNSEKLSFKYGLEANFANTYMLANRLRLLSFNSVYRGNITLENALNHSFKLRYSKQSLFKGFSFFTNIFYNRREKTLKNKTILNGIESLNTPILFTTPEDKLHLNSRLVQRIGKFNLTVNGTYDYSNYFQIVNTIQTKNETNRWSGKLKVSTLFKKGPNFVFGYAYNESKYRSEMLLTRFNNRRFFAELDYLFLNDFILTADYESNNYKNKTANITSVFDIANVSLFYQKEDSPWGFELKVTNLLNTRFKENNSFSDYLITNTKTFIFPRVWLLKLQYKL